MVRNKKIRSQISFNVILSDPNDELSPIKNVEFNFDNLVINKDKYNSTIKNKVAKANKSKIIAKTVTSKSNIDGNDKRTLISKIIKLFQLNKTDKK